jgi:SAM-dependent methyltransferase
MKSLLKKILPDNWHLPIKKLFSIRPVRFGDFERLEPFSTQFGYDRGGPVDRVYIEQFLEDNRSAIKGRVLEIGDNYYTIQYGGNKVTKSDVLHVHADNPKATVVGDLSTIDLPDRSFDCIILTQTLHLIYDFRAALLNCRRLLSPGGHLLITVPGIVNIPHDEWGKYSLYSFTSHLMKMVTDDLFREDEVEIRHFGNVFLTTCFLNGIGAPEIPAEYFEIVDPHYQLLITTKIKIMPG